MDAFKSCQMKFFPNVFSLILKDYPKQKLNPVLEAQNQIAYFLDNIGLNNYYQKYSSYYL